MHMVGAEQTVIGIFRCVNREQTVAGTDTPSLSGAHRRAGKRDSVNVRHTEAGRMDPMS